MDIDKEEIERSIAHQRKMLRTLRSRLEQRELQEAQQGINTEPHIITEIHDLTERIQRHEAEISRLLTEGAVDKESLGEVEYRAISARAWDTPEGRPTVAGAAQLEYDRLRLGVTVERAQKITEEIRAELAYERINELTPRQMFMITLMEFDQNAYFDGEITDMDPFAVAICRVGSAIRLDPIKSANTLSMLLIPGEDPEIREFRIALMTLNSISSEHNEYYLLESFLETFKLARSIADLTPEVDKND
jgi:hypothetical protein